MARYDLNTVTLETLLGDPDVVAIIDQHAPGIRQEPMFAMARGMTARQAMTFGSDVVGPARIQAIESEVAALS